MAAKRLHLAVLTPGETLLDVADVAWVQALLADGSRVSIYPGHAPLLAETRRAALRYATTTGKRQTEELQAGILQVAGSDVLLFTGGSAAEGASPDETQQFHRLTRALLARLPAARVAAQMDDAEET